MFVRFANYIILNETIVRSEDHDITGCPILFGQIIGDLLKVVTGWFWPTAAY